MRFYMAKQYFWYLLKAKSYSQLHSPLLFGIAQKLLAPKAVLRHNENIEALRFQLVANQNYINKTDYGAGSISGNQVQTKISSIASASLSTAAASARLAELAYWMKAKSILELGTSLGTNTLYLHKLNPDANIITLEGDPEIAKIALHNFTQLASTSIDLRVGTFKKLLPEVLRHNTFDFVYIDGDHRLAPTMEYLQLILPHLENQSVIVLDDIHWSPEMTEAWERIKKMDAFTYSLDLFDQGWLFKIPGTQKQDFIIRTRKFGTKTVPSVAKSLDNTNS
jgi:predicted O-methyltransferase YrrM